jgi:acyl dehydratase
MPQLLHFDNLAVGDRWVSPVREITEADVVQFADLTGDYNPLHMDEEFARHSPFRRPIAHGLLGLAVVAGLGSESPLVDTVALLGVRDWEFLKPVYFGDQVHVVTEVVDLRPNGRRCGRVVLQRSLINQDGLIVQRGTFESLVARSSVKRELASSPG